MAARRHNPCSKAKAVLQITTLQQHYNLQHCNDNGQASPFLDGLPQANIADHGSSLAEQPHTENAGKVGRLQTQIGQSTLQFITF